MQKSHYRFAQLERTSEMRKYSLPKLNFGTDELSELFSQDQLATHYSDHHGTYIKKLNDDLKESPGVIHTLLDALWEPSRFSGVYNNAAQAWIHTFFWNSLTSQRSFPDEALNSRLGNSGFKDLGSLKAQFLKFGSEHFGSGWLWICKGEGATIKIKTMDNADSPLSRGELPLLVVDLWEHAYYLDYKSKRLDYLEKVWNHLNWNWANALNSNQMLLQDVEAQMLNNENF